MDSRNMHYPPWDNHISEMSPPEHVSRSSSEMLTQRTKVKKLSPQRLFSQPIHVMPFAGKLTWHPLNFSAPGAFQSSPRALKFCVFRYWLPRCPSPCKCCCCLVSPPAFSLSWKYQGTQLKVHLSSVYNKNIEKPCRIRPRAHLPQHYISYGAH